jgi:Protein of unknown function (DUF2510)
MLYQHVRRPFWRRHPVVTGASLLLASWWLSNGWHEALAVTAIVVLFLFVRHRRRDLARRDAGLRARAEYEHRLNLAGDPRGVFGRYPPVQPGWFPDPQNPYQIRYFDGALWTRNAIRR